MRAYTCILAFFWTQLGVTHVSFDFSSPSQTAFLSSENPYFGPGTKGGAYVDVRRRTPPASLPECGFSLDGNAIWKGETASCVQKIAKTQVQALTVNYKPFNESPEKISQSKRAEVKAAGEQK